MKMTAHRRFSFTILITSVFTVLCLLTLISTATAAAAMEPSSSAIIAAKVLHSRGYSLLSSLLLSLSSTSTNFSGLTLLAPSDFAFSAAAATFFTPHRHVPPRLSIPLFLYHTLNLTWPSRDISNPLELQTLHDNHCLYMFSDFGEILLSSTPVKNPYSTVKIRQPDIYVDENLTIHGVDGILDPAFATECSSTTTTDGDSLSEEKQGQELDPRKQIATLKRRLLDSAMRGMKKKGYAVVATAMGIRKVELLELTSVTILAVSDEDLFLRPDGFRYNFRHHVIPVRRYFRELMKLTEGVSVTMFDTLDGGRKLGVSSIDGTVSIDGVAVEPKEVYRNRWIVVLSVTTPLDDVTNGISIEEKSAPSPALSPSDSQATAAEGGGGDDTPPRCELIDGVVSSGLEGGDLFCPMRKERELRELKGEDVGHVEGSGSCVGCGQDADKLTSVHAKVKIAENYVESITEDLFFYI